MRIRAAEAPRNPAAARAQRKPHYTTLRIQLKLETLASLRQPEPMTIRREDRSRTVPRPNTPEAPRSRGAREV